MRFWVAVALVWMGLLTGGRAQRPEASNPPAATLSTRSTLVVVPALVRNKAGGLVYTLKAEDFTLTDDGIPQKLTLEQESGGEPLALVVVIEADAATRSAGWHPYKHDGPPDRFHGVPAMVEAIAAGVPHQIAVVGFDSQPELELGFTSDFDAVANVIEQLDQGNTGDHGAGILDSLVFAVDLLRKAPAGYRRAILLLSETNDHGSKVSLEETVRTITETNTAIYSVAFSTPFHEASEYGHRELPTKMVNPLKDDDDAVEKAQAPVPPGMLFAQRVIQGALFGISLENPIPNPPAGCAGVDPAVNPNLVPKLPSRLIDCVAQLLPPVGLAKMAMIAAVDNMRKNIPESIAHLTGGEYFAFNDAKTLERDLATLANHVPNRYVLSFQPQSPRPGLHLLPRPECLEDYPQLKITARAAATGQRAMTRESSLSAAPFCLPDEPSTLLQRGVLMGFRVVTALVWHGSVAGCLCADA